MHLPDRGRLPSWKARIPRLSQIAFRFEGGTPICTRDHPSELLAACGGSSPTGRRPLQQYFGQHVYPAVQGHGRFSHPAAEMDKGAGIAMPNLRYATDVEWWRDLKLPTRPIIHATPHHWRAPIDRGPQGCAIFEETEAHSVLRPQDRRRPSARIRRYGGSRSPPPV